LEAEHNSQLFEVTQLINSLLGLLVFPQQQYMQSIERIPLEELVQAGWPIPQVDGYCPQVDDLNQLVRYLRNSVSHFNISFLTDRENQIAGLIVWNEFRDRTTWRARLTIENLRGFCDRFVDLLLTGEATSEES
jgi:hypothetical protein